MSQPKEILSIRQIESSVTQVDEAQLQQHHITSLKGVSSLAPNLFIPDYGSRLTSAIYIRGIGSRINTPAVGLYVDNIPYMDKSAFDFNFYGIERVEVMRGPQSTLYGRNAMGGLVKVYTRNPFLYEGTDVHLGVSTGNWQRQASVTHYHRVSDRIAFSGGGYYEGARGFFRNEGTGHHASAMENGGAKVRLLYRGKNGLRLDGNVSFDRSRERAYPYFDVQTDHFATTYDGTYRRTMANAGLNLEWRQRRFTLNAVTGYQYLRDRMFMDQDYTLADLYTLEQHQQLHTFSEEISLKTHFTSFWRSVSGVSYFMQHLTTTAPVTFMHDGLDYLASTVNRSLPCKVPGLTLGLTLHNDAPAVMHSRMTTPTQNISAFHQSDFSLCKGLHATVGLRLDMEWNKLRYASQGAMDYDFTILYKDFNLSQTDRRAEDALSGTLHDHSIRILPKAALRYEFSKERNVYASVARGMRTGGYNVQLFSDIMQAQLQSVMMAQVKEQLREDFAPYVAHGMPAAVADMIVNMIPEAKSVDISTTSYRPEYAWNYEVGTHLGYNLNPKLDLNLDAALFYIDTRDQQIARFAESGLGRMMVNAGRSRSWGGEVAVVLAAKCSDRDVLMPRASYGYTHATFLEYNDGHDDFAGKRVPYVPEHTATLDLNYSHRFSRLALHLGATYRGQGRVWWTEANDLHQPYYQQLDARLSLDLPHHISLQLWGKNLTSTRYNAFLFHTSNNTRTYAQHGAPRHFGLDLRLHF